MILHDRYQTRNRRALMHPDSITAYIITSHAAFEMRRRGLTEELVHRVLTMPEQRLEVRPGRVVLQSQIAMGKKRYLLRVVVDLDRNPAEVVTVYRTSKIAKYWKGPL